MYSVDDSARPRPVLTVSELTAQIRCLLEDTFDQVAVVGEVSNAKVYSSGHWYFSLKDKEATLPCVCFRSTNSSIKFELEDGLMVVARGRLNVYPPRGAYQLVASSLEPVGVGEWQLAFEQLRNKLEAEGLLDPARKRPIPMLPARVGVVTSLAGAALRDILIALRRRNSNVHVLISPAKVQGEGSPEEIAQAIANLEEFGPVDVILVARGGGSIEDLWSFNTEVVARAVASASVPVISGVGHETDITICDLVADLRAPTPTAAAELVAAGRAELLERWGNLNRRLSARITHLLVGAHRSLDRLNPLHSLLRYSERLANLGLRVSSYRDRLTRRLAILMAQAHHRWQTNHEKLQALGPLNVLARGYAILRKRDGTVVRDAGEVEAGELLEALLDKGKLTVKVESVETGPTSGKTPWQGDKEG
ncbi:MAG TPA: exodeoxyribonuclease VII large subunit [Candidatus Obscuribacterales bacterium]